MREVRFQLKGWAAVPVIVVVIGFLGYRWLAIRSTLASEASEELKTVLRAEYSRLLLGDIDPSKLDTRRIDPKVQRILDSQTVDFSSLKARGTDPVYVRVTIQVGGGPPPDGKETRYYKMEYSTLTGWRVQREISALSYYLSLF